MSSEELARLQREAARLGKMVIDWPQRKREVGRRLTDAFGRTFEIRDFFVEAFGGTLSVGLVVSFSRESREAELEMLVVTRPMGPNGYMDAEWAKFSLGSKSALKTIIPVETLPTHVAAQLRLDRQRYYRGMSEQAGILQLPPSNFVSVDQYNPND
jgi:hypothetical protein